ncbi:N-acetylmuramoyl-L-alanine amidase [Nonomuraea sp. GTA35]|uniref:peptidoglycan recognition protein family protein n=1 Tax=Nonomuraea sp. GTA35 TaxID=1676746 RepID=UPI0035C12B6E
MPYLTQLATVARRTGCPVTEVAGWKTRGHGPLQDVDGVVCHHTAGWNDMHVVRDGRPGLDGPLSQIWLRRDGRIFIVAAGRCWHNAPSLSLGHTNSRSIGIEAENDGRTPWPKAQLDAYKRLCAELCREFGLPVSTVKGHKEVNSSKPDPHSINMNAFRRDVAALLKGEPAAPAVDTTSWTEELVKDLPTLKVEASNYDVKTVRGCLFARGHVPPESYAGMQGGLEEWLKRIDFDDALDEDVRAFQKAKKLTADGIVGPLTWAALLKVS